LLVMCSQADLCLLFSARTSQSSFCFQQQSLKCLISSVGFIFWISVASFHQKLQLLGFCTPKMSVFGHNSIIVDSFSHVWRLFCTLSGVSFWLSTFGYMFVWAIANFWQFKCQHKLRCVSSVSLVVSVNLVNLVILVSLVSLVSLDSLIGLVVSVSSVGLVSTS